MTEEKVLVTGGSGYIAGWIIIELLKLGYRVNTTVRSLSREAEVRSVIAKHVSPDDRLAFFEADLLKDGGWNEATTGCKYVLHVASPIPFGEHAKADLIKTATEGTKRVYEAAKAQNSERVVVTSSVAACTPDSEIDSIADESVWTNTESSETTDYARSKTIAEKDAWKMEQSANGSPQLVTVLPSMVLGPILGDDNSGSLELISRLITGKMPAVPNLGFSIVDVRDLASLHIKAMTMTEAVNERFIASTDYLWMRQIAQILREELGPLSGRVPSIHMPDFVLKVLSWFQPEYKQVVPGLGRKRDYTSQKAKAKLDWQTRPVRQTIADCAQSMLASMQ